MKLISPLDHPHSGKAAILIAIALVLGITVHEVFFLIALLIAAIACIEWGAHEVHVIHERKTHSQLQPASLAMRVALHPFLTGISRTHLALLADCAIATHFEKGQTILRKGEFAKGIYLIENGEVVLESGEESGEPVMVDTIRAGDSVGWSWMFPPYVWRFTAIAVEPIDAICSSEQLWLCSGACRLAGRGCSPSFGNSMPTKTRMREKIGYIFKR